MNRDSLLSWEEQRLSKGQFVGVKAKSLSTYSPSYTLEAFAHAIETDDFAEYEKEFASRILTAIRRNKGSGEVLIVQQIRDLLKELGNVPDIDGLGFSMRTRTLFIHQFRSMVEFDYLGVRTRKELGDLAFIFSIVYRGLIYFQRLTINQVKKADRYGVWTIDKKQLRLLSQFPSFNGVAGSWVGRYRHNMPNLSGCLGSYGLIDPTEFLFVGAPDLTNFLGWRRRVRRTEILSLGGTLDTRFELPLPPSFGSRANLANYRYASNAVDFSSRFLRLGVGELVFLPPGYWDNPQARRVRWDLAVSARRHSSAEYPERGIEALKLLSLPYAMADNPAVNFPPNEPLPPPDLGLGDNGIGVVISTLVVGE